MKLLKQMNRRLRSKRGVTILEAIVAMAIIGVITLSALAVFANFNTVYDVNYDQFYARILADDALASFQYAENNAEFKASLGMVAETGEGTGVDVTATGESTVVGSLGDEHKKLTTITYDDETKTVHVFDEYDNEVDVDFDKGGEATIAWLAAEEQRALYDKTTNDSLTYNVERYKQFVRAADTNGKLVGVRAEQIQTGTFSIKDKIITYHEPDLDLVWYDGTFWKEKGNVYVKMVLEVTGTGNIDLADWYWISYEWKEVSGTTKDRFSGVAYESEAKAKEAFETLKSDLTGNYNSFKKYLDDSKHPLKDEELYAPWPIKKTFYFGSKSRLFASIKISSTSQKSYYDFIDDAAGNEIAGYIMEAAEGEAGGKKYIVNEQGEKILLVSAYADDASFNTALAAMNANPEYSEKGVQKVGEELVNVWNTYEFSKDETVASIVMNPSNQIIEIKGTAGNTYTAAEIKEKLGLTDAELVNKFERSNKKCIYTFTGTYRYKYTRHELNDHIEYSNIGPVPVPVGKYYEYDKNRTVEDGEESVTFYVDLVNCKIWFTAQLITDTYSGTPKSDAKDKDGNVLKNRDGEVIREKTVGYYYLSGRAGSWDFKRASSLDAVETIDQNDILVGNKTKTHALDIILNHKEDRIPTSGVKWPFMKGFSHVSTEYIVESSVVVSTSYCTVDYNSQTIQHVAEDTPVNASDTEMQNCISSCVSGGYVLEKKTFYYSMERVLGSVVADDTGKMLTFYDRNGTVICAFSYQDESAYATDKENLIKKLKELNYSENGNEYKPPYSCAIVLDASAENEVYEISVKDKTHDEILFTKIYASQEEYLEAFDSMGFMTEEVEGTVVTYTCQVNEYLLTITIDYSALEFHANIVNGDGEEVYVLNYDKG